jgi:hypothetical protein
VPLRAFFSMRSRCSRLNPGGGASGDGKCSARHLAQSIGSGVIGSPIVSFQRVNGLVRRASFDHLVGAREQSRRNFEAERFSGLRVDHEFDLDRLHHWQVGRARTFEDASGIASGLVIHGW